MPPKKRIKLHHDQQAQPDVIFAQDPPHAFYCLITSVEEAVASPAGHDQVQLMLDAAYVGWYQQLDLQALPPLDGIAAAAGTRLFEILIAANQFDELNQGLFQNTGHALTEYSWWMLEPGAYNLRGSVRIEEFLPPLFDTNPASIAEQTSLHQARYLMDRLIVPRDLLKVRLFALREFF